MANTDVNADRSALSEQEHEQVREFLPLYATVAALERDPQLVYPTIAAHLQCCLACRDELAELQELTLAAYTGQVAPAPAYPRADLSFLPAPAVPPPKARGQPWRLDELGRLVIQFSAALLETLRPPTLAGASRGQLLYSYTQEHGSIKNLDARIEVFAMHGAPGRGLVRVVVDVPGRNPFDQGGSLVVLRADDQEWRGETDESGQVDFAAVPLAAVPLLRIEIAPYRE
jgi:hypothetical protein